MSRAVSRRQKTIHAPVHDPAPIVYPPAPWALGGWGFATIGLVDSTTVAATVPAGVHVVDIVPKKTLGGLAFLSYDRGSLVYHELTVIAGLVRVGKRLAFWLPRLFVDNPASLAGGREIWGVSKELATFDIVHDIGITTVDVRQDRSEICRIRCSVPAGAIRVPMPLHLPTFGERDGEFLFFKGRLDTHAMSTRATVTFPEGGRLGPAGIERPWFAVRFDNAFLNVPAPSIVPKPATTEPQTAT